MPDALGTLLDSHSFMLLQLIWDDLEQHCLCWCRILTKSAVRNESV